MVGSRTPYIVDIFDDGFGSVDYLDASCLLARGAVRGSW